MLFSHVFSDTALQVFRAFRSWRLLKDSVVYVD